MLILFLLYAIGMCVSVEEEKKFLKFMNEFNRKYERSSDEYRRRLQTFVENLDRIKNLNIKANGNGATFGVTQFADLTPEEFRSQYLTFKRRDRGDETSGRRNLVQVSDDFVAPEWWDWRQEKYVTSPYDQGNCGSCWAHAAIEALESQMAIKGYGLQSLSVQQLVDCDMIDGGCDGGDTVQAWEYMQGPIGGIANSSAYGYTSGYTGKENGICKAYYPASPKIKGYRWANRECWGQCNWSQYAENNVIKAVASDGPPAICINAEAWQYYTGGIMTDDQCGAHSYSATNHCAQIVGYTSDYWMVRNSWSYRWGHSGYIWLKRGENTCGVLNEVNYPTIEEKNSD